MQSQLCNCLVKLPHEMFRHAFKSVCLAARRSPRRTDSYLANPTNVARSFRFGPCHRQDNRIAVQYIGIAVNMVRSLHMSTRLHWLLLNPYRSGSKRHDHYSFLYKISMAINNISIDRCIFISITALGICPTEVNMKHGSRTRALPAALVSLTLVILI